MGLRMVNDGWIKIWRPIFDSWLSNSKPWCDGFAWCYLCAKANFTDGVANFRNEYIEVKRGQFITSQIKLAQKWGWTRKHVKTFLNALKNDEKVTIRTTNRYIVLTIVNYDIYQSFDENNDQQNGQQEIQQKDNRVSTEGHNIRRIKNDKKEEKEIDTNVSTKKTVSTKPKRVMISYTQEFENFFKMHPWHVTKEKAFKEWQQLSEDIKIKIMEVLPKQLQDPYLSRENFKYFCRPQAWLHQGRWEDELNQKPQSKYGQSNADAGQNRNGVYINPDRVFKETDSYDSE